MWVAIDWGPVPAGAINEKRGFLSAFQEEKLLFECKHEALP